MNKPTLIQITSSYFVAGIVLNTVVTDTAPILNYMKGWNEQRVVNYAKTKNWKIEKIKFKPH